MTRRRNAMNPNTILRLEQAWRGVSYDTPRHTLYIGAYAGTWPGTVYRAYYLGYLTRVEPAWYVPTTKMLEEVARIGRLPDRR